MADPVKEQFYNFGIDLLKYATGRGEIPIPPPGKLAAPLATGPAIPPGSPLQSLFTLVSVPPEADEFTPGRPPPAPAYFNLAPLDPNTKGIFPQSEKPAF